MLEIAPESVRSFCTGLMIVLGLLSLALAAFFIVRQNDYKRMLAYSSMEHMGLVSIMWALGMQNVALLQIIIHALLKVVLFMTADNIQLACNTQKISSISGLLGVIKRNGINYILAVLLLCGMPPSPLFFTEMQLIYRTGSWLGGVILLLLFVVFSGMTYHALRMTMGKRSTCTADDGEVRKLERLSNIPAGVLVLVLATGVVLASGFVLGELLNLQ